MSIKQQGPVAANGGALPRSLHCPGCRTRLGADEAVWIVESKFYCGQSCALAAANRK